MKLALTAAAAVSALMAATPAFATIIAVTPSSDQGFLVHGDGGAADVGELISGDLNIPGNGNAVDPRVYFQADLRNDSNTVIGDANDDLRIQQGSGQAEIESGFDMVIDGVANDITKLNLFLDATPLTAAPTGTNVDPVLGNTRIGDAFGYIELALIGSGTVSFALTDDGGQVFNSGQELAAGTLLTSGENKFAFRAIDGQTIQNLRFDVTGGAVSSVRQVRLGLASNGPAPIPEPATWAMMIFGFGAIGGALRRKKAAGPRVRFNLA